MINKNIFCRQNFNFSNIEKRMLRFGAFEDESAVKISESLDNEKVLKNESTLKSLSSTIIARGANQAAAVENLRNAVIAMQNKGADVLVVPDKKILIALAVKRGWITDVSKVPDFEKEEKLEQQKGAIRGILEVAVQNPATQELVRKAIANPGSKTNPNVDSKNLEFALRAYMATPEQKDTYDNLVTQQGSALMVLGHLKLLTPFAPPAKTLSRPARPNEGKDSVTLLGEYGDAWHRVRVLLEPIAKNPSATTAKAEFENFQKSTEGQYLITVIGQMEQEFAFRSYVLKHKLAPNMGNPKSLYAAALANEKEFYKPRKGAETAEDLQQVAKDYAQLWLSARDEMRRYFYWNPTSRMFLPQYDALHRPMNRSTQTAQFLAFRNDARVLKIIDELKAKEKILLDSKKMPEFISVLRTTFESVERFDTQSSNLFHRFKDGISAGEFKIAGPNPFTQSRAAIRKMENEGRIDKQPDPILVERNSAAGRLRTMENIVNASENTPLGKDDLYQLSDEDAWTFLKDLRAMKVMLDSSEDSDVKEKQLRKMTSLCERFYTLSKRPSGNFDFIAKAVLGGSLVSLPASTAPIPTQYESAPQMRETPGSIEKLEAICERARISVKRTDRFREPEITEADVNEFTAELTKLMPFMRSEANLQRIKGICIRFQDTFQTEANVKQIAMKKIWDIVRIGQSGNFPSEKPVIGLANGGSVPSMTRADARRFMRIEAYPGELLLDNTSNVQPDNGARTRGNVGRTEPYKPSGPAYEAAMDNATTVVQFGEKYIRGYASLAPIIQIPAKDADGFSPTCVTITFDNQIVYFYPESNTITTDKNGGKLAAYDVLYKAGINPGVVESTDGGRIESLTMRFTKPGKFKVSVEGVNEKLYGRRALTKDPLFVDAKIDQQKEQKKIDEAKVSPNFWVTIPSGNANTEYKYVTKNDPKNPALYARGPNGISRLEPDFRWRYLKEGEKIAGVTMVDEEEEKAKAEKTEFTKGVEAIEKKYRISIIVGKGGDINLLKGVLGELDNALSRIVLTPQKLQALEMIRLSSDPSDISYLVTIRPGLKSAQILDMFNSKIANYERKEFTKNSPNKWVKIPGDTTAFLYRYVSYGDYKDGLLAVDENVQKNGSKRVLKLRAAGWEEIRSGEIIREDVKKTPDKWVSSPEAGDLGYEYFASTRYNTLFRRKDSQETPGDKVYQKFNKANEWETVDFLEGVTETDFFTDGPEILKALKAGVNGVWGELEGFPDGKVYFYDANGKPPGLYRHTENSGIMHYNEQLRSFEMLTVPDQMPEAYWKTLKTGADFYLLARKVDSKHKVLVPFASGAAPQTEKKVEQPKKQDLTKLNPEKEKPFIDRMKEATDAKKDTFIEVKEKLENNVVYRCINKTFGTLKGYFIGFSIFDEQKKEFRALTEEEKKTFHKDFTEHLGFGEMASIQENFNQKSVSMLDVYMTLEEALKQLSPSDRSLLKRASLGGSYSSPPSGSHLELDFAHEGRMKTLLELQLPVLLHNLRIEERLSSIGTSVGMNPYSIKMESDPYTITSPGNGMPYPGEAGPFVLKEIPFDKVKNAFSILGSVQADEVAAVKAVKFVLRDGSKTYDSDTAQEKNKILSIDYSSGTEELMKAQIIKGLLQLNVIKKIPEAKPSELETAKPTLDSVKKAVEDLNKELKVNITIGNDLKDIKETIDALPTVKKAILSLEPQQRTVMERKKIIMMNGDWNSLLTEGGIYISHKTSENQIKKNIVDSMPKFELEDRCADLSTKLGVKIVPNQAAWQAVKETIAMLPTVEKIIWDLNDTQKSALKDKMILLRDVITAVGPSYDGIYIRYSQSEAEMKQTILDGITKFSEKKKVPEEKKDNSKSNQPPETNETLKTKLIADLELHKKNMVDPKYFAMINKQEIYTDENQLAIALAVKREIDSFWKIPVAGEKPTSLLAKYNKDFVNALYSDTPKDALKNISVKIDESEWEEMTKPFKGRATALVGLNSFLKKKD